MFSLWRAGSPIAVSPPHRGDRCGRVADATRSCGRGDQVGTHRIDTIKGMFPIEKKPINPALQFPCLLTPLNFSLRPSAFSYRTGNPVLPCKAAPFIGSSKRFRAIPVCTASFFVVVAHGKQSVDALRVRLATIIRFLTAVPLSTTPVSEI